MKTLHLAEKQRRRASLWANRVKKATLDAVAATITVRFALLFTPEAVIHVGEPLLLWTAITAVVHVATLYFRRAYSANARYFGQHDAITLCLSGLPAAIILALGIHVSGFALGHAKTALIITLYALVSTLGMFLLRLTTRTRLPSFRALTSPGSPVRRIMIVGAGDAGETIVHELIRRQKGRALAVGLVDDDETKQELRIHGVPVLGFTEEIPSLVRRHLVDEIILAIPASSGAQIRRIHELCRSVNTPVRTLPAIASLFERANSLSSQLREIRIEDLLRRDPVESNMAALAAYISGRNVMITGGGGSIGSELSRQIAGLNPGKIILVGKGENSLYEIQQELIQTKNVVPIVVVADVRDEHAMTAVFEEHAPTVIFHAAAHKHVPLMQSNLREAIRNNILGTLVTAQLADKYRAEKFVLISSDKAVRPTSVMGATKRICEMIVSAMSKTSLTDFSAVRFGNVLGSRGSLVPLLTAQIRRGGPITVTDKAMTRYFMTIPEAVQLVLEAGHLGRGGEICILDMGEPVRIDDLARELVRLHGLIPDEDITIQYTGIRPGEKMFEELVYEAKDLRPTKHPKISSVLQTDQITLAALRSTIDRLVNIADSDPDRAMAFLMDLCTGKVAPPNYKIFAG